MNKQEAINELMSKSREIIFGDDENVYLSRKRTIELVSQINEPQKVTIPKFVADFYESIKDDFEDKVYDLCLQFNRDNDELSSEVWEWFGCGKNEPIQTLVKMKLYGYEVEKEKLYTVEIPNPNSKSYINVLKRVVDGIIVATLCRPSTSYFKHKEFQLTEAEIKQDFAWAWQWAKEVE